MTEAAAVETTGPRKATVTAKSKPKTKEVEVVKPTALVTAAEDMRVTTRTAYDHFRKSWFEFAKAITIVHDSEVWSQLGFDSFKDYCLAEFQDMDYVTITKFIHIMKGQFGKLIEQKLKKNPNAPLPGWDTCYQLTRAESKFPKAEVPRLVNDVLEGKITKLAMRERIKEIDLIKEAKADAEAEKQVDEEVLVEEVEALEAEVDDNEFELQCGALLVHSRKLCDGLAILKKKLSANEVGGEKAIALAEHLYEKLLKNLNDFTDKMERLAKED